MPRPAKPHAISKLDARRIWLGAQRLDSSAPFGEGPQAVADAVAHLGYVQIDTINVIERCHHHILYTRIPAYRRADLRQAQSADKSVFEYWTHALSYVPSSDFRFFMPDMRLHKREGHRWFANRQAGRYPQGDAAAQGRCADHPRHRGRRADREGASVGEPQAVEARAAACLLLRHGHGLRAHRHAQDL